MWNLYSHFSDSTGIPTPSLNQTFPEPSPHQLQTRTRQIISSDLEKCLVLASIMDAGLWTRLRPLSPNHDYIHS